MQAYIDAYVPKHVHTYTHSIPTYTHDVCIYAFTCMHAYIMCMYLCMYVQKYTYWTHLHVHMYMCTYIHVYGCYQVVRS